MPTIGTPNGALKILDTVAGSRGWTRYGGILSPRRRYCSTGLTRNVTRLSIASPAEATRLEAAARASSETALVYVPVGVRSRFVLRIAVFYQSDVFCTPSHMQFYSSLSVSEVLLVIVPRSSRVCT